MTQDLRLSPGDTVGILGGGQLGRMLAIAAASLGLRTHIFCPDKQSPAFDVSAAQTVAAYEDKGALTEFAAACAAVTYEFENVPGETAAHLATLCPVRPGVRALEVSQDRLAEKDFLTASGVALAAYARIDTDDDLTVALQRFGGRGVLKTRRFGYDGKGQVMIRAAGDADGALDKLKHAPAVLEQLIGFEREVSVIVARDIDGKCDAYDVSENHHENHILKTSTVPREARSGHGRRGPGHGDPDCGIARLRRCHGRRNVPVRRPGWRRTARQRDCAESAQFRPLDGGRMPDLPVRTAYARRLPAGLSDSCARHSDVVMEKPHR
jgi:hypothetical protein